MTNPFNSSLKWQQDHKTHLVAIVPDCDVRQKSAFVLKLKVGVLHGYVQDERGFWFLHGDV